MFVAVACVWLAVVAYRTWGGDLPQPLHWSFSTPSSDGREGAVTAPVASADASENDAETRSIRSSFVDAFDPDRAELPKFPPPPNAPPAVAQSPENQARIDAAEEKRSAASGARDAFLDTVEDEATKRKARVYSDAAIAGVAAKHVEADITAADEREACEQFFAKMHVDPTTAFCEVSRAETDEGGKSYVQDLEPEEAKMAESDVQEANMDAAEEEEEESSDAPEPDASSSDAARAAPAKKPAKASVAQRQKDRELEEAKKELAKLKKQLQEKEARDREHSEMDAYEDELAHQAEKAAAAGDDGVAEEDASSSYEDELREADLVGADPETREDGLPTEMEKQAMDAEMEALKQDLFFGEEEDAGVEAAMLGKAAAKPSGKTKPSAKKKAAETDAGDAETRGATKSDEKAAETSADADAAGSDSLSPEDAEKQSFLDAYEDELRESQGEDEVEATVASTAQSDVYVDFVVDAVFTPTDFPAGVLDAAVSALQASGVPVDARDEQPLKALEKLEGVDGEKLQNLMDAAAAAAEAEAAILYPPPPSPSPPPPAPFYPTANAPPAAPWPPEPPLAPRSPPPAPRPPPPPPPIDTEAAMSAMFSHAPPPPLDEAAAKAALFAVADGDAREPESLSEDDEADASDTPSTAVERATEEDEEDEEDEEEAYAEMDALAADEDPEEEEEEEVFALDPVEDEDAVWWYKQQGKKPEGSPETETASVKDASATKQKEASSGWWEEEAEAEARRADERDDAFEKLFAANPSLRGDAGGAEDAEDAADAENAVDYQYEAEGFDPDQKRRERAEAAAEAKASAEKKKKASNSAEKVAATGKKNRSKKRRGASGASATSRGVTYDVYESANALHVSKTPSPPMLYPSPPPPLPPDYSDVYEAAALAMTDGVGVKSSGDAQMKLIANEILLMENEIGVNKFNHLFEAYSQPALDAERGKSTEKEKASEEKETKSKSTEASEASKTTRKKRLATASKPPRRAGF